LEKIEKMFYKIAKTVKLIVLKNLFLAVPLNAKNKNCKRKKSPFSKNYTKRSQNIRQIMKKF